MTNEKMTALYCRSAHTNDDAIAMQEATLRNFASDNGYSNISVYKDNGENGINFNRPALSILEAEIDAGRIGMVIVHNISRIGRDIFKMQDWIVNLRRKGVSFISVTDGLNDSHFEDLLQRVSG